MASNVPTIRQIAWISLVPQFLLMGIFVYLLLYLLNFTNALLFGALAYLILSFGLRNFIAQDHRKGISLVKQQKYADAIPCFEKSVEFFSQNNRIDQFRFLTMLSSSKMSYREMGLCNIAFCYSQTGNKPKSIEFYRQTLADYPENGMAKAALKMIE